MFPPPNGNYNCVCCIKKLFCQEVALFPKLYPLRDLKQNCNLGVEKLEWRDPSIAWNLASRSMWELDDNCFETLQDNIDENHIITYMELLSLQ